MRRRQLACLESNCNRSYNGIGGYRIKQYHLNMEILKRIVITEDFIVGEDDVKRYKAFLSSLRIHMDL